MKRDYIRVMPKPGGLTAVKNHAMTFELYYKWHPHIALEYRSPWEYLRRRSSNKLSYKKVYGNEGGKSSVPLALFKFN